MWKWKFMIPLNLWLQSIVEMCFCFAKSLHEYFNMWNRFIYMYIQHRYWYTLSCGSIYKYILVVCVARKPKQLFVRCNNNNLYTFVFHCSRILLYEVYNCQVSIQHFTIITYTTHFICHIYILNVCVVHKKL